MLAKHLMYRKHYAHNEASKTETKLIHKTQPLIQDPLAENQPNLPKTHMTLNQSLITADRNPNVKYSTSNEIYMTIIYK